MTATPPPSRRFGRLGRLAVAAVSTVAVAGCGADDPVDLREAPAEDSVFDATSVHEIGVTVDETELAGMIDEYRSSGDKDWIHGSVTIDGTTFGDVGLRLKGNSSLRSVSANTDPALVPWLVDLAKYTPQSLDGVERFVIRSNSTETSLNEAVALGLLGEAGLATTDAVATRFTVNGGEARLRLMVQDLDGIWDGETFGSDGTLYKSEATGDWSYRGDDPDAYDEVFDVEAGAEDYAPLTGFLRWLDKSTDEEFASGLADRLDVVSFATYLAFEDLIGNFDDIDGPGNNSFLRWSADDERFTVVAWDHNLAFGASPAPGDGGGRGERPGGGGDAPGGFDPGAQPGDRDAAGGDPAGTMGSSNILAERFRETDEFADLYDDAVARLTADLLDSGSADELLDSWATVLTSQASDLVDRDTVTGEAATIAGYFDGHAVTAEQ